MRIRTANHPYCPRVPTLHRLAEQKAAPEQRVQSRPPKHLSAKSNQLLCVWPDQVGGLLLLLAQNSGKPIVVAQAEQIA